MDSYYQQWKAALDDFRQSVEKDLQEIRQHKAEVQQMRLDVIDRINQGQYIRDDERIVISAPEIVIGNVDKNGTLIPSSSAAVTIRANRIAEEGVGSTYGGGGSIVHRATSISNICVDSGIDGREQVVNEGSAFVVQARNVVLQSDGADGCFASSPTLLPEGGIRLHADKRIDIEAAVPANVRKELLETRIETLKEKKDQIKTLSDEQKTRVDQLMVDMEKLFSDGDGLNSDELLTRTNYVDIIALNKEIGKLSTTFCYALQDCVRTLSDLAETNRQITCLEDQKKAIEEASSQHETESTGAAVTIQAERMNMLSVDGDGKLRTNVDAGLGIVAKNVDIRTLQEDGQLMEESTVSIQSQTINLSTVNVKQEWDDEGKLTSGEYTAVGDVNITSKNIKMESVDYELKDEETVEKALTEKGSIKMRTETLDVSATDTEGQATGAIRFNSKAFELKSMNVDKEKRTDTELAQGSTMLLLSEKMYAGSRDKEVKSQSVQIVSDKVGVFADTTAEVQQGEAEAALQLDGGNVVLSGGKAAFYGETTLNGATSFKADVKAGGVAIDNLEVKSSFKTPCTSEGVAVPASPSTDKLSAKLKAEDAPKQESES